VIEVQLYSQPKSNHRSSLYDIWSKLTREYGAINRFHPNPIKSTCVKPILAIVMWLATCLNDMLILWQICTHELMTSQKANREISRILIYTNNSRTLNFCILIVVQTLDALEMKKTQYISLVMERLAKDIALWWSNRFLPWVWCKENCDWRKERNFPSGVNTVMLFAVNSLTKFQYLLLAKTKKSLATKSFFLFLFGGQWGNFPMDVWSIGRSQQHDFWQSLAILNITCIAPTNVNTALSIHGEFPNQSLITVCILHRELDSEN
jgi:hypothetical protein